MVTSIASFLLNISERVGGEYFIKHAVFCRYSIKSWVNWSASYLQDAMDILQFLPLPRIVSPRGKL